MQPHNTRTFVANPSTEMEIKFDTFLIQVYYSWINQINFPLCKGYLRCSWWICCCATLYHIVDEMLEARYAFIVNRKSRHRMMISCWKLSSAMPSTAGIMVYARYPVSLQLRLLQINLAADTWDKTCILYRSSMESRCYVLYPKSFQLPVSCVAITPGHGRHRRITVSNIPREFYQCHSIPV